MHYILTRSRAAVPLMLVFAMITGALSNCQQRKAGNAKGFETLTISMQKNTCYGKCPSYLLEIDENGHAKLDARKHLEISGPHEKQLTKEQLNNLLELFKAADFYDLNDMYMMKIPDLPATVIKLKMDDQEKQVIFDMDYPDDLKAIEEQLIEIAETATGWKPIEQ